MTTQANRPKINGGGIAVGVAMLPVAIAICAGALATGTHASASGPDGGTAAPPAHAAMPGMEATNAPNPSPASEQRVFISPERQQLIGVRTAAVEERVLSRTIRTVGVLAYDETRITMVHPKIAGWVDQLFVDYVGKFVKRGQPLLTVYSPALVATQREYLLALDGRRQLGASEFPEARTGAESLLAATRERLKLWDISDAQIDELARTGQVRRTLMLTAPFDGIVLERNTFAGQYIAPETTTFKIADLSTIWAIGQIFEYELSAVQIGQTVRIEFPYGQSTRPLTGQITFIYPDVDPMTRRVRIRAAFDNPRFEFKPETYVTMVIEGADRRQLAVPKEAVIDTGTKRYVILARPNGYFEPREIDVGPPADDFYPVEAGLYASETIVTSALFLIDSETNLKAAMQAMSMSMPGMTGAGSKNGMEGMEMPREGGATGVPANGHAGHTAPTMPADMPMGADR